MDQILILLINNWTILISPTLSYFLLTYFLYKNSHKTHNVNSNSWINDSINSINKDIVKSRGYNNFIMPISYIIRKFLDEAINKANNDDQRKLSRLYTIIDHEVKNITDNPFIVVTNIIGFRFLWKYYFSTRTLIHDVTLNSIKFTTLRTNNRFAYITASLMQQINSRRKFLLWLFRKFT
jgi:hypothetical protein